MADFCAGRPPDRRRPTARSTIPPRAARRGAGGDRAGLRRDLGALDARAASARPGHPDLDPFWALLRPAASRSCCTSAPARKSLPKAYLNNGRPRAPDLHGGGENLRFKDYVVAALRAEMFLTAMVYDGVFERFPTCAAA